MQKKRNCFFTILIAFIFILSVGLPLYGQSNAFVAEKEKDEKQKDDDTKDSDEEKDKEKKVKIEIDESEFSPVTLGELLAKPGKFINKKVVFQGEFSSFTTLALDYEPALRDSKDYISITIFRPETQIPLSELKLAYPVEEAKDNEIIKDLEKGDTIEIYAKGFSAALDEPWLDILLLKRIASASPKKDDKEASGGEENNLKDKSKKDE